jgi:hypothetical protein
LGKRRRDEDSSDSDVPDDVKSIPMPRDTPPPIPKEVLDKWYQARRDRMNASRNTDGKGTSANSMPLGQKDRRAGLKQGDEAPPQRAENPMAEAKTVYEAKPVVRDLRKEAVSFVPAAVRVKLEKSKGIGGLVEPEEADILEKAGYMGSGFGGRQDTGDEDTAMQDSKNVMLEEVDDEDG